MADFYGNYVYGAPARPNWTSTTGVENLTSNMEFITITTSVAIGSDFPDVEEPFGTNPIPGPVAPTAPQVAAMNALNKLLEIIAERGQPIIMGNVTGTGPYQLFLVTEHLGWTAVQGYNNSPTPVFGGPRLLDRIATDGINFGFGTFNNWQTGSAVANTDTALAVTIGSFLT